MKKMLLFLTVLFNISYAGLLIMPEEVLKENFPNAKYEKKNILLLSSQKEKIEKLSGNKLNSNIFTTYIVKKDNKIIGYAILHSHKVRTKNEVILISFDKDCKVKDVEIIAFYEPPEYMLNKNWLNLLKNKDEKNPPYLKRNIPNATGATLSSRATADAVRESIYICEIALKDRIK